MLRQNGRAIPLEPKALRDAVADGLALLREQHDGESPALARERRVDVSTERGDRPVGPIAPERFGVLQALLAHVLSACGENRDARLDADDLAARFSIPREELQDTLSLLNLVNFGGGCYTVYAEVDEDAGIVRVDKELYGDVFRKPPRLTPLEARAIRLAIDYVGPTIAAEAHTPLDRVRKKLEETFGQFDLPQTLRGDAGDAEEQLVRTLSDAVEKRRVVEIEYLKEGDETPTTRSVEPYSFVRELPVWRVHTWDRTADGPRTYRLDRMRSARLTEESFEPREAFDPSYLTEPRLARLWHSPVVARWKVERGGAAADRQGRARRSCRSRPTNGSSPRCSPTPARRSCSSRPTCGRASPPVRARSSRSSGSRCAGSARQHEPERRSLTRASTRPRPLPRAPARSRARPRARGLSPVESLVSRTPGSNMRSRSAAGMPSPSSATSITTEPLAAAAVTVTSPPSGECPIALPIRLSSACRSRSGSPIDRERRPPSGRRRRATRERRRLGRIARQRGRRRSARREAMTVGGLDEEALDARRARLCELEQPLACGARPRRDRRSAIATSAATGLRISCASTAEASRVAAHPARSPIRSTAQRPSSASIGSSLAAHSSASGSASARRRRCRARRARSAAASAGSLRGT